MATSNSAFLLIFNETAIIKGINTTTTSSLWYYKRFFKLDLNTLISGTSNICWGIIYISYYCLFDNLKKMFSSLVIKTCTIVSKFVFLENVALYNYPKYSIKYDSQM